MRKKHFAWTAWVLFLLYMLSGCKNTHMELASKTEFYFDTIITLSIEKTANYDTVLEGCISLCDEIENSFSRTKEGSELFQINHRLSNQVTVSDEMAYLIGQGLYFYKLSDGAFDITIAPVLKLWDFKSKDAAVPDAMAAAAAAAQVDAGSLHLAGNQLSFANSDTQIDLGALVKGYAADRIKDYLLSQGVTSAIINLGGNVVTVGKKPDGTPWKVGIQKPFAPRDTTITTVSAEDKSVVSSGVYERYFKQQGVLYHHIIDPRTGYPVQTDLWQATIISESSLEGDAFSTICMLLGEKRALALLKERKDITVKFVLDGGALKE